MSPAAVLRREDLARIDLARRVVVKIGSSSLTDDDGRLDARKLTALVHFLAARRAAALAVLGLPGRPRDLSTGQAAASVGQGLLIAQYTRAFAAHDITVGQVLLTVEDVTRRSHYKNAQQTLTRLLALGVVPIINEN